jgi:hypothetical protein
MRELIQEFSTRVVDGRGGRYVAAVYGSERRDGTWAGWLEFSPTDSDRRLLTTGQETSQPNRRALEYWASGLEPVYLEGALARAQNELP